MTVISAPVLPLTAKIPDIEPSTYVAGESLMRITADLQPSMCDPDVQPSESTSGIQPLTRATNAEPLIRAADALNLRPVQQTHNLCPVQQMLNLRPVQSTFNPPRFKPPSPSTKTINLNTYCEENL